MANIIPNSNRTAAIKTALTVNIKSEIKKTIINVISIKANAFIIISIGMQCIEYQ